jgi:hypothetical protein
MEFFLGQRGRIITGGSLLDNSLKSGPDFIEGLEDFDILKLRDGIIKIDREHCDLLFNV